MLALGAFRPDMADTNPGVLADLLNASIKQDAAGLAYGPVASLVVLSTATALPSAPKGALTCVTAAGVYVNFVMTASAIYLANANGTYTLLGSGYNLPSGDKWGRCQFGDATADYAIFSNTADGMLKYDLDAGGAITAVSGAPKARILGVVFDSLFALDNDGENRLMRNADINTLSFTGGTSGYQPMPDGEELVAIGEVNDGTAIVAQRNAIRILYRNDTALMFNMRKPISNKGFVNPWCAVLVNGALYGIDTNGFQKATLAGLEPIGRGKVDKWWLARLDTNGLSSVEGAYDAEREVIRWRYQIGTDTDTVFTSAIDYDIGSGEFVPVEESTSAIFTTATPGYTMEELDAFGDMDNLNGDLSLDDRFYFGGQPQLGGLDENYKLGYFSGPNLAFLAETATITLGKRTDILEVCPVTDSPDVLVSIGAKDRLSDALVFDDAVAPDEDGICPTYSAGRYIRFRSTIAAGSSWTYMRGYEDDNLKTAPGGRG